MEYSGFPLFSLLLVAFIADCFAETTSCNTKERSNPTGSCQVTCNVCRVCGPCICKSGYIRSSASGDCISEADCHKLHLTWMSDAKYGKFFNCSA